MHSTDNNNRHGYSVNSVYEFRKIIAFGMKDLL